MNRYARITDNIVTCIIFGECPSEDWIEYPLDAPDFGLDYEIAFVNGIFVKKALDLNLLEHYSLKRTKVYPPTGDQLDAIWKALDTMNLPQETKEVLDKIKQVKQEIPKPNKEKSK